MPDKMDLYDQRGEKWGEIWRDREAEFNDQIGRALGGAASGCLGSIITMVLYGLFFLGTWLFWKIRTRPQVGIPLSIVVIMMCCVLCACPGTISQGFLSNINNTLERNTTPENFVTSEPNSSLPSEDLARFGDDFNDNRIASSRWEMVTVGSPYIFEKNEALEVTIPAGSKGDLFSAGCFSQFKIRGDFDIVVDYKLQIWPAANGTRVGIDLSFNQSPSMAVERVSYSGHDVHRKAEVYVGELDGTTSVSTNDKSGKLRITRKGTSYSTFYADNDAQWHLINTNDIDSKDKRIFLGAWGYSSSFDKKSTVVIFDNFQILNGKIIR